MCARKHEHEHARAWTWTRAPWTYYIVVRTDDEEGDTAKDKILPNRRS